MKGRAGAMLAMLLAIASVAGVLWLRRLGSEPATVRMKSGAIANATRGSSLPAPARTAEAAGEPALEKDPKGGTCPREAPLPTEDASIPPLSELRRLMREAPRSLGSASLGSPTRGSLWNGIALVESDGIVRAGDYPWGTERVVRSIERAVREVRRCHPNSPRLHVGDIARQHGGWLRPHRSHQAGLDADLGYYYRTNAGWYERATAKNLDVVRSWALVDALIAGGNVDTIFMDASVQALLRAHVETLPVTNRPSFDPFQTSTKKDSIIRHTWGHATHFHVRFHDPRATELGKRIQRELPANPPRVAPRRTPSPPRRR